MKSKQISSNKNNKMQKPQNKKNSNNNNRLKTLKKVAKNDFILYLDLLINFIFSLNVK